MSNKKISELPIGNLKPETIIPIVTDGLTSKITFNELKVKITPFEYGQDGEGLNNIKQRNSNNIANSSESIIFGSDNFAGYRAFNGTIFGDTVVISDNIDYTSGFTSGIVIIDNVEFSYSGIAYNAPDFTFTTSGGPKIGSIYNYSVEYSPIDSSLLTLLEAAQDFFDYDDDEFEVTLPRDFTYMVGDLVCDTLVVGTNGQSNFTKTGGVNMAYDVTNCCDGDDEAALILNAPNGVTLKILNNDGVLFKLYSGLVDNGNKFVIRIEGAYYEDGDGTPLSSPTIIYNYVFSINNPNTFDLVIEKNSYDSSIDENKIGFTTTDGVITSEFDSASPATIRVKALLEPKPVLIHDKLDINNLSAPNLLGSNIIILGSNIVGTISNTTYVDKFNIKNFTKTDSISLLGVDLLGNVVKSPRQVFKVGQTVNLENSISTNTSLATGGYASAFGVYTTASGDYSTALGAFSNSTGAGSFTSGYGSLASGNYAYAEGDNTTASGPYSHAQGSYTIASGRYSDAAGSSTRATGDYSHAGGFATEANGEYSFVHGVGSYANGESIVVLGADIFGNQDNTTYVDNFNINTLGTGTSVNTLGVDVSGYVVAVKSPSSGTFTPVVTSTSSNLSSSSINRLGVWTKIGSIVNVKFDFIAAPNTANVNVSLSISLPFSINSSEGTQYIGSVIGSAQPYNSGFIQGNGLSALVQFMPTTTDSSRYVANISYISN